MKLPAPVAVGLITIGFVSRAFSDPGAIGGGGSGGYNTQPSTSMTSASNQTGSSNSAASPSPTQSDSGVGDDTLYRSSTGAGVGAMLRDEGILREKPRAREKVVEVDSTKKLPSSGSDPRFQGSLLNLGPGSIDKITLKTNGTSNPVGQGKSAQPNPISQAREREPQKKLEPLSASSKLDLSLLPNPSATASPAAKDTASPKQ